MRKANSYTLYWMGITFLLFPVLAILGIYMRTVQAGGLAGSLTWFYPMMTLHGVGMVGVWYVAAMACAADILSRYTEPSPAVRGLALFGTLFSAYLQYTSIVILREICPYCVVNALTQLALLILAILRLRQSLAADPE